MRCFRGGFGEFTAHIEAEGLWTDDVTLRARVDGTAIELIVRSTSYWVLKSQLVQVSHRV